MQLLHGAIHKKVLLKSRHPLQTLQTIFLLERTIRFGLLTKEEKAHIALLKRKRERILYELPDIFLKTPFYKDKQGRKGLGRKIPGQSPSGIWEISLTKWALISSIPHIYGAFLYLAISRLRRRHILEVGTGLGISTLYLLQGITREKKGFVESIEGSNTIAEQHKRIFANYKKSRYRFLHARIENVLPQLLKAKRSYDFVFHDGEHQYETLMRDMKIIMQILTSGGIVVIDDINWTKQMRDAWKKVETLKDVIYTATIFSLSPNSHARMGLLVKGGR